MPARALIGVCLLAALAAAGCGSGGPSAPTTSSATSTEAPSSTTASPMALTVFRVVGGALRAESVTTPQTAAVAGASLRALGLDASVTIAGGTATVDLPHASPSETAEVVYTLTQYPTVQRVDVAGRQGLTRADVESFVPAILVESPAAGASVRRDFRVTGTAMVFEATFVVELAADGKVLARRTVTASAGAPERGTFALVLHALRAGPATVVAYAPSAENGEPQHRVEVPVTVMP